MKNFNERKWPTLHSGRSLGEFILEFIVTNFCFKKEYIRVFNTVRRESVDAKL